MEEVELGDHQRKAVKELSNGKILTGGVGVGKSRVAVRYYVEKESPRDVFVITTAKKRDSFDWEEECVRQGVGTTREGTFHGVLTVDSWNNLWKYAHVENAFFIFDEQRLVGSGAWVHAFYKIAKKNRWILLSATPGDTWLDYIPVFVANSLYKNRTEFLREHVVYSRFSKFPKVERYIGVGRLVRHKNNLLVEMPYQRHTRRIIKHVPVEFDEPTFKRVVKDRWHVYENRPLRDVAELFSVMRKVVNSDSSRLGSIRQLLNSHSKIIVFYNFDYELEILRTLSTTATKSDSPSPTLARKTRKGGLEETTTIDRDMSISVRKSNSGNELEILRQPGSSVTTSECPSEGIDTSQDLGRSGATPQSSSTKKSSDGYEKKPNLPSSKSSSTTASSQKLMNSKHRSSETSTPRSPGITSAPPSSETQSQSLTPVSIAEWNDRETTHPDTSPSATSQTATDSEKTAPTARSGLTTASTDVLNSVEDTRSVQIAEWNGHKHEPIPKADRWVYLVQYQAGAEGWNCTETDVCVFYSLNYSYRIFEQCQGRIDRMNTPFTDLYYYVLRSKSAIDAVIWRALIVKKKFNEPRTEQAVQRVLWDVEKGS